MEGPVEIQVHRQAHWKNADELSVEYDSDLEKRQMSYPIVPVYNSPKPSPVHERLGLLTPTEELPEDSIPSSPRVQSSKSQMSIEQDTFLHELPILPASENAQATNVQDHVHHELEDKNLHENDIDLHQTDEHLDKLIDLQSRQERVLDWQEKSILRLPSGQVRHILRSSEMDTTSVMKSLRSIPPSNFSTVVQEMTNSLTTLRSQLSTLNAISLFGERLQELQPIECNDLDLLPLIKKLCTIIGESRSPESALTLTKLIRGAGPLLVVDDFITIINSNNTKRKPAALDGLTYALLTFPRDDFDLEKVSDAISKCIWNPKRRIRQGAIECLAVIAHVLGPGIAMPFLRELIEQNRPSGVIGGNPSGALSARVSRRVLPSPSPLGLVDYVLVLPTKDLSHFYLEQIERGASTSNGSNGNGKLDPILSKGAEYGADVVWILHGTTPGETPTASRSQASSSHRSSDDGQANNYHRTSSQEVNPEVISSVHFHEVLQQRRWDTMEHDHLLKEKLAEMKLEELARNYERSLVDDDDEEEEDVQLKYADDFLDQPHVIRDRDSGVSSLKSLRVMSPTDSSPCRSPVPNIDSIPQQPIQFDPTSLINSNSSNLDSDSYGGIIRKPTMARTSRTNIDSYPPISGQGGRVIHSPPPPPPKTQQSSFSNITPSTSASSLDLQSNWSSSQSSSTSTTKIKFAGRRKAKSTSRDTRYNVLPSPTGSNHALSLPPTSRGGLSPKHSLSQGLSQLSSPDWETNVDGFVVLTQLLRNHPDQIRLELTSINRSALLHLSNLRTQVTRAACLFFADQFTVLGKSMEHDSEKIAEKLLDKTADTNKFIRDASLQALEAMVKNLTPAKVLIPLEGYGSKHRNSVVRCTTAQVTRVLIEQQGAERILHQHSTKVIPMLIKFLQEGSLETRTHAKAGLSRIVGHGSFDPTLKRCIAPNTLKQVEKTINTIKHDLIRKC